MLKLDDGMQYEMQTAKVEGNMQDQCPSKDLVNTALAPPGEKLAQGLGGPAGQGSPLLPPVCQFVPAVALLKAVISAAYSTKTTSLILPFSKHS